MKRLILLLVFIYVANLTISRGGDLSDANRNFSSNVVVYSASVALENEYFLVMRNSTCCAQANTPDFG